MKQIDLKKIQIKILNDKAEIREFNCKNNDLNEFLKEDSFFQKNLMLNTTYLAFYEDNLVGFLTMSTDNLKIKDLGKEYKEKFQDKGISYKIFPSIKLGRLGIDVNFQKRGIGERLIKWLIKYSVEMSEKIGFRFITVDAYVSSYNFYYKNYFEAIPENIDKIFEKFEKAKIKNPHYAVKMTIPMYLDLYSINLQLMDQNL